MHRQRRIGTLPSCPRLVRRFSARCAAEVVQCPLCRKTFADEGRAFADAELLLPLRLHLAEIAVHCTHWESRRKLFVYRIRQLDPSEWDCALRMAADVQNSCEHVYRGSPDCCGMPLIRWDAHSISVFAPTSPVAVAVIRNTSIESGTVHCFEPGGGLTTVAVLMLLELLSEQGAFSFSAAPCPFVGTSAAVERHEAAECELRVVTCTARKFGCKFEAPCSIARLMMGAASVMESHVSVCVHHRLIPSFELEEQHLRAAREKETDAARLHVDTFDKYAQSLRALKASYGRQHGLGCPRCAHSSEQPQSEPRANYCTYLRQIRTMRLFASSSLRRRWIYLGFE